MIELVKCLLAYSIVSHLFYLSMQWCHMCKFKTRWKERRFNRAINTSAKKVSKYINFLFNNLCHYIKNLRSFAIVILVFFLFFLLVTFSGRAAENVLANVLRLVIKETCDQDLAHSLDTSRNISVKIVFKLLFATHVAHDTDYVR